MPNRYNYVYRSKPNCLDEWEDCLVTYNSDHAHHDALLDVIESLDEESFFADGYPNGELWDVKCVETDVIMCYRVGVNWSPEFYLNDGIKIDE